MTAERRDPGWVATAPTAARPPSDRPDARRARSTRRRFAATRHAGWWLALGGSAVGMLMVISMITGATALQLVASVAALVVSVISPATGLIVMAFAAPLARPLVVPLPGIFVLMAAAMVFGMILRLPVERPRLGRPPAALVLLGLFALYVVTQVVGGRFTGGPPANEDVVPRMARLIEGVLAFAVAYLVLRRRSPYPLLMAMLLSSLVAATVALSQVVGLESVFGGIIQDTEILGRITGTFVDPNYFGVYMAMMLSVALALSVLMRSWRLRVPLLAAAIPLALALVFTQSRGALLALAAGLVAIAFARSVRAGIAASAGLLVLAVAAYPLFAEWRFGTEVTSGLDATALTSGRTMAWFEAVELAGTSPLFGIGFARFSDVATVGIGAHNWYFQVLAEMGIVGTTLWLLFIIALVAGLRGRPRPAQIVGYPVIAVWLVGALSLAPPTAFQVTGPLLIIVAAAFAGDWTSQRLSPALRSPDPRVTASRSGDRLPTAIGVGASRSRP